MTEFAQLFPPPAVVTVLFPFARPEDEGNALWASFRNLNLRRERLARFPFVQLWWISSTISARAELEASDLVSWFKLRLWLNELPVTLAANKVAQLRMLVSDRPELVSELAGQVMSLGNRLGDVGRYKEALQAAEESVRLRRDWVRSHPGDISTLADALNNLGIRYHHLGRHGAALSASEEALTTYRQLSDARPEAFLAYLAMS